MKNAHYRHHHHHHHHKHFLLLPIDNCSSLPETYLFGPGHPLSPQLLPDPSQLSTHGLRLRGQTLCLLASPRRRLPRLPQLPGEPQRLLSLRGDPGGGVSAGRLGPRRQLLGAPQCLALGVADASLGLLPPGFGGGEAGRELGLLCVGQGGGLLGGCLERRVRLIFFSGGGGGSDGGKRKEYAGVEG